MNKNLLNLYLVASLLTLIPGIMALNTPNPIPAFSNVITQSMHQLSILATNGPNTDSFQTLAALLKNLLGSMQLLSEPYWNKQINELVNQNDVILSQIESLENQLESNTALNINTLNSVNVAYSSQLVNSQIIVSEYSDAINAVYNPLMSQIDTQQALVNSFPALIASFDAPTQVLITNLGAIAVNVPTDQDAIMALKNIIPNQSIQRALSGLTPVEASFYCNEYSIDFATPFMTAPDVIGTVAANASPVAVVYNNMDFILTEVTPTGVKFQVCDQGLGVGGAGLTFIDSSVNLLVFSKDQ
jgi:hypothetical protein